MASVAKYLARLMTGRGDTEVVAAQLGGASYAGQIPALDATTGLLAVSMMPSGVGPDTDTSGVCSATALTAGMYVNIYNAGGVKTVRPADATDNTKPAHGFVLAGFTVGQTVTVYMQGAQNTVIPVGAYVAADVGKALYLSTSGGVTTTRPSTTGNYEQYLGDIVNVGSTVSSAFTLVNGITVA